MNISDEAVEIAAKTYYEQPGSFWNDTTLEWRKEEMADFRAAIESAADLIAAAAWDEGYGAGKCGEPFTSPYRKDATK